MPNYAKPGPEQQVGLAENGHAWTHYLDSSVWQCPSGGAHEWRLDDKDHGECVKCREAYRRRRATIPSDQLAREARIVGDEFGAAA